MLVTAGKLAAIKGCSLNTVKNQGFPSIRRSGDNAQLFDTDLPAISRWEPRAITRSKRPAAKSPRAPKPPPVVHPTTPSPSSPKKPRVEDDDLSEDDDLTALEKIEKILTHRQNRDIKARELVPREDVRQVFMRFYAVHTSILQPVAGTLGPRIANELGLTDVQSSTLVTEFIDRALFDALAEMKSVMLAQLTAMESRK